jgi:hypothetical protein
VAIAGGRLDPYICNDAAMKRTSVLLPDPLAALLDLERRRRDVSAAEIIRLALESYLNGDQVEPKRLGFIGHGRADGADPG